MTSLTLERPASTEHIEYFSRYIDLVPAGDILESLERQIDESMKLLKGLGEKQALHRYAPGKWSVKDMIGHVIDSERVFAYRALRFARADETPLPGFDHDLWVPVAARDADPWAALLDEWRLIRQANIAMFRGLDDAAWRRSGKANDNPVSVRALAWIIAGHELHHMKIIRERYLRA
jgi:hypothetical protein